MSQAAAIQFDKKAAPSPPMRTAISRRSTEGTVRNAGGRVDSGPAEFDETDDCRETVEVLLRYLSVVGRGRESARERAVKSTGLEFSALSAGEGSGDEEGVSCKKLPFARGEAMGARVSQVPGTALSIRSIAFC